MFKQKRLLFSIVLIVLLSAGTVLSVFAKPLADAINWSVLASGGRPAVNGSLQINSTIGQPLIGPSTSGDVALKSGYWGAGNAPTAVLLSSFRALPAAGGVLVAWQTTLEIDLLGFKLYRSTDPQGPKQLLTADLIPAKALGQSGGADYAFLDTQTVPDQVVFYWLESLDIVGSQWSGPQMFNLSFSLYVPLLRR